jgi:omega-6 fatty acid desaturase (delta-12 desaturase)
MTHVVESPEPPRVLHDEASYSLKDFRAASLGKSLWQLSSTLGGYVASWTLAWNSFESSRYLLMAISVTLAAGLLLRLFVLAHDCGHGSFFRAKWANATVGSLLGVLIFTPFHRWRKHHAIHHATNGDLDRRGGGDVNMLTVREFAALSTWRQWKYRCYRHPLLLFGIGPILYFVVWQRFVHEPREWKVERRSVHWTNLGIAAGIAAMCYWLGAWSFLAVEAPVVAIASSAGVWLFYVQHHYEETYWRRHGDWNYTEASLSGSSYYCLPVVLQWLTANIGLHHIHHLDSQIPNYRLQECLDRNPALRDTRRLTLWQSLACARLRLWDEDAGRMVTLSEIDLRPSASFNKDL